MTRREMRSLVCLVLLAASCKQPDPPPIGDSFTDDFSRKAIGSNYLATADVYRIKDGALNVSKGYNHPLWLRKKLPANAEIELDVWSTSKDGDMKIEVWGDGESFARDRGAYTGTGYIFNTGGWGNSKSQLARAAEHGTEVSARTLPKVEPDRRYHWKIVRRGGKIDWYVDDMSTPFLSYEDKDPLSGPGHEYFGFTNWETDVWFDNLTIRALP
jgi:hypothetical protein